MNTVSIICPVYNEKDSLEELFQQVDEVFKTSNLTGELILVNDGSWDGSRELIDKLSDEVDYVKSVHLKVNSGQTAAMMAGLHSSTGEYIAFMDADLQNDPSDIPMMVEQLEKGYDLVSGWRQKRNDKFFSRILPSVIANKLISKVSKVHLKDYGCTLKLYRRKILEGVELYGEMHRFIPIYASWNGARIFEMPVKHRERKYGKTNYGLMRTFKVILDLMFLYFFGRYASRPMHAFGSIGIVSLLFSLFTFLLMAYLRIFKDISFIKTPLPEVATLFFITGIIAFMIGLVAEIQVRIYFKLSDRINSTIDTDKKG